MLVNVLIHINVCNVRQCDKLSLQDEHIWKCSSSHRDIFIIDDVVVHVNTATYIFIVVDADPHAILLDDRPVHDAVLVSGTEDIKTNLREYIPSKHLLFTLRILVLCN